MRREAVEDDRRAMLDHARARHMEALEALALAHAELAVSVDVHYVTANEDAERPRRIAGGRR